MVIERALDRLIGIVSPSRERERMRARQATERERMYAAAKSSRLTGGWTPVEQNVNDLISSSAPQVRAKVRQLVRDFPYFAKAVDSIQEYVVGEGFQLQSRVKVRNGDKLDQKRNQQIEDAWKRWCEEADISGQLHFDEMVSLAKRQEVEAGEYIFIKVPAKRKSGRFLPFALQAVEPDRLSDLGSMPSRGNDIRDGIEFDPQTGEKINYWIENDWGKAKAIPADRVIHGYRQLRPGQLRGISCLAPAVMLAYDLGEYMDAEIDGAKNASKYLGFVTTGDPGTFQGARAQTDPQTGQKVEELENAIIEYLRPGEQIDLAKPDRPAQQFEPFTRLLLRMIAVTSGLPYEVLSSDYHGLNYNTLRSIRNDLIRTITPQQNRLIWQMCRPVYREFLDKGYLAGVLDLPGYPRQPHFYQRAEWVAPGVPSADPLKEGKAAVDQIKNNLRSPQETVAARGRDLGEVMDELAEAKQMAEARGLSLQEVSTSTANNPSSVAGQD